MQSSKHHNKHSSNFENFISMGTHYGSNRALIQPGLDLKPKIQHDNLISKSTKFEHIKAELNKDINGERNYLIISNPNNLKARNQSIEEKKSGNSHSSHSPMLTKRKNSQRMISHSSKRQSSKRSIEKSNQVGLISNLNKHSKASRSETRNTER